MASRRPGRAAISAATIVIARAKNDQEGVGSDRFLNGDTMNHVRAWLLAAGLVDGALFRAVLKGGRIGGPLHPCEISRALRELAPKEAGRVSGHSLRIGGCQDMANAGIQLLAIQQAGGWKSATMPALYNRKAGGGDRWRGTAREEAGAVAPRPLRAAAAPAF